MKSILLSNGTSDTLGRYVKLRAHKNIKEKESKQVREMNRESYKIACKSVMESAMSFVEKGKKEFGEKKLEGGWFVFRVQTLPTSNTQELISSISETVFNKVGVAYNYDNLYFFPLFEEMEIVFQTLQKLDNVLIEAIGIGWLERTDKEYMICNFTMMGDNRQATTGLVQINGLELKWLSEPIFTIEKSDAAP